MGGATGDFDVGNLVMLFVAIAAGKSVTHHHHHLVSHGEAGWSQHRYRDSTYLGEHTEIKE